jgi:hypothetical protein
MVYNEFEIIDTSDAEEREAIDACSASYWRQLWIPVNPAAGSPGFVHAGDVDGRDLPNEFCRDLPSEVSSIALPSFSENDPLLSPGLSHPESYTSSSGIVSLLATEEEISGGFIHSAPTSASHPTSALTHKAPLTLKNDDPQFPSFVQPDHHEHNDSSRYALRTRNAKQLKPYVYDQLLYNRQMRSNPDAIVKIVSPRRKPERGRRDIDNDPEEDQETFDQRRTGKRPASTMSIAERPSQQIWYPGDLQGNLSGDGEEDTDEIVREAQIFMGRSRDKDRSDKRSLSRVDVSLLLICWL